MKPAAFATTVLLLAVAALHLARILAGVPVTAGETEIPMWVSVLGVVVPAALAFGLWRERRV